MRIITLFILITSLFSFADLRPPDLSVHLSSDRNSYTRNEVIQFNITFTNHRFKNSGVLLPGNKNKGKRMLYFAYYSVDSSNFYTNVHTESRVMDMDTSKLGQTGWKNLEAGASVTIPIFINDTSNFHKQNAAHHVLPDLPSGKYEVLVWYEPWDEPMAQYAYKQLDPFGGSEDEFSSERIYLDQITHSNYFSITITDSITVPHLWNTTDACPKDCKLCAAIDDSHWTKVQNLFSRQSDYSSKLGMLQADSNWLQPHRNITWISPPPDAILASLPTYTYRSMVLKNADGYYYFYATWQLGRTFPTRSSVRNFIHRWTRLYPPIIRDEQNYKKLVKFKLY